jgi:hypothetical protein
MKSAFPFDLQLDTCLQHVAVSTHPSQPPSGHEMMFRQASKHLADYLGLIFLFHLTTPYCIGYSAEI